MKEMLEKIIDLFPGDLNVIDSDYNLVYTNVTPRNHSIEGKNMIGHKCYRHCRYIQNSPEECCAKAVYQSGDAVLRKEVKLRDGGWIEINCLPVKDDYGNILLVAEYMVDITRYKEKELDLSEKEKRFQKALETSQHGVWEWNMETGKMYFSDQFLTMLGFESDQVEHSLQQFNKWVHPADAGKVMKAFQQSASGKKDSFSMEYRMYCSNGQYKWVLGRGKISEEKDGNVIRLTGSHEDISKRKMEEEMARFKMLHDPITGLYNRQYFEDALKRLDTDRMYPLSVMIIKLEGFQEGQQIFSPEIMDETLKQAAGILRHVCRHEDIIARWSEDEFAVIFPTTPQEAVSNIFQRITDYADKHKEVIRAKLVMGAATREDQSASLDKLMKTAARQAERNQLVMRREEGRA